MITQTCSCCGGTGKVPLPTHLVLTLSDFMDVRPVTTYEGKTVVTTTELMHIAKCLGRPIKFTALCNRLRKLESLGLVGKIKSSHPTGGAWYFWYKKEATECQP